MAIKTLKSKFDKFSVFFENFYCHWSMAINFLLPLTNGNKLFNAIIDQWQYDFYRYMSIAIKILFFNQNLFIFNAEISLGNENSHFSPKLMT